MFEIDDSVPAGKSASSLRRCFWVFAATILALASAACAPSAQLADPEWAEFGTTTQPIDHSAWDSLLSRYVTQSPDGINRVEYAALKAKDASALRGYLSSMQAIDITQYPRNEQFAYWVNLYNAATVDLIVANYPLDSIRDLGLPGLGPWRDDVVTVNGKDLSLDDIEHGILRPIWQDVRVHYAVNCASIGCPNLAARAYTGAQLDAMLEAAAADYINHPRGFARLNGRLVASRIYDWYGSDWGDEAAVLDHARKYANRETLATLGDGSTVDTFDYDWSLNAAN